ncbi:MAG: DEAD/DEAH box helicase [bacterium]
MIELIKSKIRQLRKSQDISERVFRHAQSIFLNGQCQLLTQSKTKFEFTVNDEFKDYDVALYIKDNDLYAEINKKEADWNHLALASLMQLSDDLTRLETAAKAEGKKYTRKGMIKRVMAERQEKAHNADYRIEFADNIYGEHTLTNERGVKYKITLRDFENETGYIDCMDLRTNKLGTTKHIMFAFKELKSRKELYHKLSKHYPFVEVYLDPLNDYKITWHYPQPLDTNIEVLIAKYFGDKKVFPEKKTLEFLGFIREAEPYQQILIRPEVFEKVEKAFTEKALHEIKHSHQIDFSSIKADLFPYQKEGIEFAVYREGAIIADDMGLGKTMQAIGTAVIKKEIFDFKRTLVICPASLKEQWKNEIERFSNEKAVVVEGFPHEREKIYRKSKAYFLILNYETVLRDCIALNKYQTDFIILDEAQRIKNYTTKTANAIKSLKKNHALVITGTPIENKLIDLYSVVEFIDPYFLAPLWEFSYQHCLFDQNLRHKITGYYNLKELKERLQSILIRREKRSVLKQLPNISECDVPVEMHPMQADYHASYAKGVASILSKKFITPFDMQKLMLLLSKMRMVCDSTNLVDHETNHSPKLEELKYILFEKLAIQNNGKKVIIFSEWVRMNIIIGMMLRENNVGFAELSGKVPVKHRGKLIQKFEENSDCKVFISTEAGGSGLNLQVADTVINFELPWNPAKKNQRIGRIDRLGQESTNLTVINFITKASIEERIASGLILKQNLFDGVLDSESQTDFVDFSEKGRSQFLKQLEGVVADIEDGGRPERDVFEDEAIRTEEMEEVKDTVDSVIAEPEDEKTDQRVEEEPEKAAKPVMKPEAEPEREPQHMNRQQLEEMEQVMQQGLGFLSGLYKMTTGKDLSSQEQKIEIDKETGEVVMRFKLPVAAGS